MIIICNECDTHFNLDESLLKQTGSKVRCSKCKNVFLAYSSSLSEEPDRSSEVETELEVAITDKKIEWSEQYKVEEADTESQEIDFSDIDNLLEINEDLKAENKPEESELEPELELELELESELEPELELELELGPEIDEAPAETETELELEPGDKTDSEISAEEEPENIEIETGINGESDISYQREDKEEEESSKPFNMGDMPDEQEAEKSALTEKSEPPKVAAKKSISMPVLLLLLAVFLISGAYGIYVLLDRVVGINIPFISDLLKSEVQDVGTLKIYTSDINNKFVENSKIGKLLVITGKAKNGYSDARGYISITGKLYTKGKILSKTKTVYCGTLLSELDLVNMDLDSINNILSNRFGDNKSDVEVKAGLTIPFMIVFADLPENLDEFTIEVAGSFPL